MNKSLLIAIAGAVLVSGMLFADGQTSFGSSTNKTIWSAELNALTVHELPTGKVRGSIQTIPLKVAFASGNSPMRISISDDTSGGSGDMIRASVWNAAAAAAMLRGKTMEGLRISVDFEGDVDGPSAGGLICLGILSALDERKMPEDFAMTGTILPDGTVGLVGGVAYKLKGAAVSGKIKRVAIPSFLRFENDSENGDAVDLFRLGEKLGIKVYPVSHVEEAYRICHSLTTGNREFLDEREVVKFDRYTDNALIGEYRQLSGKLIARLKNLDGESLEEMRLSPCWNSIAPDTAANYFAHGAIVSAFDEIAKCEAAFTAFHSANKAITAILEEIGKEDEDLDFFSEAFSRKIHRGDIDAFTNVLARVYEKGDAICNSLIGWDSLEKDEKSGDDLPFTGFEFPFGPVSEAASQLFSLDEIGFVEGLYVFDVANRLTLEDAVLKVRKLQSRGGKEAARQVLDSQIDWVKNDIFDLLRLQSKKEEVYERIVKAMPEYDLADNGEAVAKLFYNAWRAIKSQMEAQVISDIETSFSSTKDEAMGIAARADFGFSRYVRQCFWAEIVQRAIREEKGNIREKGFTIGVDIFRQVETFVHASALLLKYTDAGYNWNTGRYENTAFLSYAINNARECALSSMAECRKTSVPYIAAIREFELAENLRDSQSADRIHAVLEHYWMANMKAKVLRMAFKKAEAK